MKTVCIKLFSIAELSPEAVKVATGEVMRLKDSKEFNNFKLGGEHFTVEGRIFIGEYNEG